MRRSSAFDANAGAASSSAQKPMLRRLQSEGDIYGLLRKPHQLVQKSSENLLSALHQESRWESQGGWDSSRKREYQFERDASMVNLLNLLDPESLVDQKRPLPLSATSSSGAADPDGLRGRAQSLNEQHSSLSGRGVILVGTTTALAWYVVRLVLRDRLGLIKMTSARRRMVLEMHSLSALHAAGWVVFLLRKLVKDLRAAPERMSEYCSRALVVSLGFYLHDCWALRGTLMDNPLMFAHQATVAMTITSILRSKGVAWLSLPLMSSAVPTLMQQLLLLCGTLGLPATRPEVRGLRFAWIASFVISKLMLIPFWMRSYEMPEMHQPNLLLGKAGFLTGLVLNVSFMLSAARDLRHFLRPTGERVPALSAYRMPLTAVQTVTNTVVTGFMLGGVFTSYLTAPVAAVLTLMASRTGSSGLLKALAGILCTTVLVDQVVPQPKECVPAVRLLLPVWKAVSESFGHRFFPDNNLDNVFRKDRHYMLAVTPHGFFPWGIGLITLDCLRQGYLPNFVGASVLGALPVAGRVLRVFGYQPATPARIRSCLQKKYPRNVTIICPGGIREMFCIRRDVEISAANIRLGFVELAKESGAMLVPGYMFGNSQLYQVAGGSIGRLFEQLSRKLRTSFNLFHGVGGTLLPYPQKLACALGEPIDTREMESVAAIHDLWCKRLKQAFDEHKETYGWRDRQLFFEGETLPPRPYDPMDGYSALPKLSSFSRIESKL